MIPDVPPTLGAVRRVRAWAPLLVAGQVLVLSSAAYAHSTGGSAAPGQRHPTGHVYDRVGVPWPPQPRGITNVISHANPVAEAESARAKAQFAAALEKVAFARGDVRQALGSRFARTNVIESEDKSGVRSPPRLVYFSHDRNATVEVTVDGPNVRSVKSIPPSVYQPEITDGEITQAIGIARTYYGALGRTRVEQLEAFGILAYKPTGNGFYDSRVIYISFHPDNDSDPEFEAWVDISNQRVLRAREEQQ